MIDVTIDYGITNEWIATFADEETYAACLPALEKYAEKNRGEIVESVTELSTDLKERKV